MKKTFVIALSILMLFSFIACNNNSIPGGMIPPGVLPGGGGGSKPEPTVPEDTIQVGDKTYQSLAQAIEEASEGSTIKLGAGEFNVEAVVSVPASVVIEGAGKDKTFIIVNGNAVFAPNGESFSLSNLTISDETETFNSTRRLIDVHSSKLVIDNVKIEGKYLSEDLGKPAHIGIVTDGNVTDVSITNSEFIGIRMPISLDFDDVDVSFKATISDNYFDKFEKLSISHFNDSIKITNNKFGTDLRDSFQIELYGKPSGYVTPEQAIEVAKANECIVEAEIAKDNSSVFDKDGAVISDIGQLKNFASGFAGSNARIATSSSFSVSEAITFSANNLVLAGNDAEITVSSVYGLVISGNNISLSGINFKTAGTGNVYCVVVNGDDATVENCSFTGDFKVGTNERTLYGLSIDGNNASVLDCHFNSLRIPFYFDEDNNGMTEGTAKGNIITDCYKLDLETVLLVNSITENTFQNGQQQFDIAILSGGNATNAIGLASNNIDCKVKVDNTIYNSDGEIQESDLT